MSEIRTRQQGSTPFFPNMLNNGSVEVCLKEDVDKTLAEKDKELRHQKYKRCLAMASSCSDKASAEYASSYVSCDEYYYHHAEFWERWHKRWLELAKKFNEEK